VAYVVLESSVRTHRKMLKAGPAACWLWACGLGYCQEGMTDGHIPEAAVDFLGVRDARPLAVVLEQVGLWDRVDDGWQVHDYHDHNKPAEEVRRIMRARQDGGKLGGRPPKPYETLEDNHQGSRKRNLPRNPSGTSGTTVPTGTTGLPEDAAPPSAAPPSAPAVLRFAVTGRGGKEWGLTPEHLADLRRDYEHLDVLAECKKASAWLKANPGRTKTAKGMPAFLVNWLNRATNTQTGPAARVNGHGQKLYGASEIRSAARTLGPDSWAAECVRFHDAQCGGPNAHRAAMATASEEVPA
jgi:hypothetical protein